MPDAADAYRAYLTARGWLDSFSPPPLDDPDAAVDVRGCRGICVVLRRNGEVVGIGQETQGERELLLRRALGRALTDAWNDPIVRSTAEEFPERTGRGLLLEVEFAGEFTPEIPSSWSDAAARSGRGMRGVAVRRGNEWAVRFPAQLRANNTARAIEHVLPSMATGLGLPRLPLAPLRREHGLALYTFATTHLAQATPSARPFVTLRGDFLVPASAVTREATALAADRLAEHVLATAWPSEKSLGVRGRYRIVTDDFEPALAPPFEHALAAYGLSRYAGAPGVDPATADAAASLAERILLHLAQLDERDGVTNDPALASAILDAIFAAEAVLPSPAARSIDRLRTRSTATVKGAFDPERGFAPAAGPGGEPVPLSPMVRAMVARAWAALLKRGEAEITAEATRAAIDGAWASIDDAAAVALLPWAGWAELDYAAVAPTPAPTAERLRRLAETLRLTQIDPAAEREQPDLAGGFRLAGASGLSEVSSQSLRPGAWVAAVAARAGADGTADLHPMLRGFVRYLIQLSVRPESAWWMRRPPMAMGGLRDATWDSDQPVPAQALGLAVLADILRSWPAVEGAAGKLPMDGEEPSPSAAAAAGGEIGSDAD